MGEVIKFPGRQNRDPILSKLMEVSDRLDQVIRTAVIEEGLDAREVAGVLAHRLGCLMRTVDAKGDLWDVCSKVARKQAALDLEA
jgi:hypothetical protein